MKEYHHQHQRSFGILLLQQGGAVVISMIAATSLISIACSMRHGVIVWGSDPIVFKDACQASVVNREWHPSDPSVRVGDSAEE